jgi:CRP/FNR family cyclic AMP-dependent transcriptional regulator
MTKELRKRPQAPTRSKATAQIPSGPIRSELNIIAQLIDRLTLSRRPPKRAGSALCNDLRTLGELQFYPRQPDTNLSFSSLLGVHSRYGLHTRAVTVFRDTLSEGFSYFVTSIAAPVASGWSGCRVGLAPTGKRRLSTAHGHSGRSQWSIALQPLPDFDLDPPAPVFRYKKKCARPTVNGGRSISKYRKNQTVFRQGDLADSVFFIREGKVKVCVVSEQGKEAVVAIHGKGDFFGEGCLTGQPRRLATVTSMTECVIMRLDKATIVRVVHDEPKFSEMFMSFLLARNARVEEDLVDQLFNSSEKRLARLLLLMANFGKDTRPELVIAKISQETLAEMIGTTRSRVSAFMNKFRKLGFIEYNGQLEIHHSLLSMVLHETPQIKRGADSEE